MTDFEDRRPGAVDRPARRAADLPAPPVMPPGSPAYGSPPGYSTPAVAPGAPAPRRTADRNAKPPRPVVRVAVILLLVGAALMVAGTILPWLSGNGGSINGFDQFLDDEETTGGIHVFVAVVLGAFGVTLLLARRVLSVAILAVVVAALDLLVALGDLSDISDFRSDVNHGGAHVSFGIGLPMLILGLLVSLGGGIVALSRPRRWPAEEGETVVASIPPMPSTPSAPPGWYHDGHALRWWDGRWWGQYAPSRPPAPAQDPVAAGTTLAVLSHLGIFAGGVVLPIVCRVTEGERNEYVRHHSTEALNFQITFLIVWLVCVATMFGTALASWDSDEPPLWWWVSLGVMTLAVLGAVAMSAVGAIRAGQGRWWRYPVSIRFVRGASTRATATR